MEKADAWHFIELSTLTLTAEDIRSLPEELAAFFACTCLAINDMQVLRRSQLLTINAAKHTNAKSPLEFLALLQWLTEDRLLSARLYEFKKFFEKYVAEREVGRDLEVILSGAQTVLEEISNLEGYKVAKWMRNKITNHLDIEESIRAVRGITEEDNFSISLHETQWNTWHQLGEQVLSFYGLQKFGEKQSSLASWHLWIDRMYDWTLNTHNDISIFLLERYLPAKHAIARKEIVSDRLIGDPNEASCPLFFIDFNGMDR